jgi:hypothetical protein
MATAIFDASPPQIVWHGLDLIRHHKIPRSISFNAATVMFQNEIDDGFAKFVQGQRSAQTVIIVATFMRFSSAKLIRY